MHAALIYSCFLKTETTSSVVISWIWGFLCGFGTTIGSHRLFTHRTFKANQTLKIVLVIFQTMAGQEPVLHWARDHRVHHKFTDTNADPYNSRRGFWFAHMGWLCCKKHPDVIRQGKKVDMSDLESDPVLVFQRRWDYRISLILIIYSFNFQILHSTGNILCTCASHDDRIVIGWNVPSMLAWKLIPLCYYIAYGVER